MKFEKTQVWGFEHALRGMRNPKESYAKSDSHYESIEDYIKHEKDDPVRKFIIGDNDMDLSIRLLRSGTEHRKYLRQIFVSVDITAPLYWWKEYDTYKVATVANSTSTMHKLASTPITLEGFEIDDLNMDFDLTLPEGNTEHFDKCVNVIVDICEALRQKYNETKDKKYWKEMIRWLPEGWNQRRTLTLNYETLLAMCSKGQRRFHKQNEWSGIDNPELPNFIAWARTLPYAQQYIFNDELADLAAKVADEITTSTSDVSIKES